MNWIQRKIYLYNVTFGLYMLDWWERYLFNALVLVLMWYIFYNSSRYISESYKNSYSSNTVTAPEQVSAVKNGVALKFRYRG